MTEEYNENLPTDRRLSELTNQHLELKNKFCELQEKYIVAEAISNAHNDTVNQLRLYEDELKYLRTSFQDHDHLIKSYYMRIQESHNQFQDYQIKLNASENLLQSKEEDLNHMSKQVEDYEVKIHEAETRCHELELRLQYNENRIEDDTEQRINEYKVRTSKIEEFLRETESQLDKACSLLKDKDISINKLESKIHYLEQLQKESDEKTATAQCRLQEWEHELVSADQRLIDYQIKIAALADEMSVTKSLLVGAEIREEETDKELNQLQSKILEWDRQTKDITQQNKDLKKKCNDLLIQLEEKDKVNVNTVDNTAMLNMKEVEIGELRNELEMMTSSLTSLTMAMSVKEEHLQEVQEELSAALEQLFRTKASISDAMSREEQYIEDIEELRSELLKQEERLVHAQNEKAAVHTEGKKQLEEITYKWVESDRAKSTILLELSKSRVAAFESEKKTARDMHIIRVMFEEQVSLRDMVLLEMQSQCMSLVHRLNATQRKLQTLVEYFGTILTIQQSDQAELARVRQELSEVIQKEYFARSEVLRLEGELVGTRHLLSTESCRRSEAEKLAQTMCVKTGTGCNDDLSNKLRDAERRLSHVNKQLSDTKELLADSERRGAESVRQLDLLRSLLLGKVSEEQMDTLKKGHSNSASQQQCFPPVLCSSPSSNNNNSNFEPCKQCAHLKEKLRESESIVVIQKLEIEDLYSNSSSTNVQQLQSQSHHADKGWSDDTGMGMDMGSDQVVVDLINRVASLQAELDHTKGLLQRSETMVMLLQRQQQQQQEQETEEEVEIEIENRKGGVRSHSHDWSQSQLTKYTDESIVRCSSVYRQLQADMNAAEAKLGQTVLQLEQEQRWRLEAERTAVEIEEERQKLLVLLGCSHEQYLN
eukprot:gene1833-3547_t